MLLMRLAWRYRSEIVPAVMAGVVLAAGWWLHAAHPGWWPFLLVVSDLAAFALAMFGGHIRLTRLAERLYAAAAALAVGGWLAIAAILGPLASPMLPILLFGALIFAVPWWAHRRRRARAQMQRAFAPWPDIARAVGLPGAKIQSARVDLWGWRARVKLAYGQTIADLTAGIPAIESALGTYRGAISIHSAGDGKANWCELRVLDTKPHTEAIPWAGPSARSITEPVNFGSFEDAGPCRVSLLRRHALLAGAADSGESDGLSVLVAVLAACNDVVIWAVDLRKGIELGPWVPCIDRLATTPAAAAALLADAVTILQARTGYLAAVGRRTWEPTPAMPAVVIVIAEYAELADKVPVARGDIRFIARCGRVVAVTLIAATLQPAHKAPGQDAVWSQMDIRICFRVRERKDVDPVLGRGMLHAGWHAHTLDAPGKFLISAPEHTSQKRAWAYRVTDEDVARTVARFGSRRPQLDDMSCSALNGWDR
jgi:S-DNA-T family DNA segregation ATPase FtsK/SpoIIIE